mmetsp:Transcript_17354/g.24131  ORF Transcript_17354/g.24131 Transcript_17354/m.24131 type:complete len:109 (+) Transcript_17354:1429-1755(+)
MARGVCSSMSFDNPLIPPSELSYPLALEMMAILAKIVKKRRKTGREMMTSRTIMIDSRWRRIFALLHSSLALCMASICCVEKYSATHVADTVRMISMGLDHHRISTCS